MKNFNLKLSNLLSSDKPFVLVSVTDKYGSIPSSIGAKMIVTEEGYDSGTIGGGALEYKAVNYAQEIIKSCINSRKVSWNLSKELNMTCSGEIELFFDLFNKTNWQITIFGAGHVARALIKILETMDCAVNFADSKDVLKNLSQNSFILIMTHSHDLDLEVLQECLKYDFRYIGVLGSKSKRKWLESKLEANKETLQKIHCPAGLPIGNNTPAEIAVSIAAQLLQKRDKLLNSL